MRCVLKAPLMEPDVTIVGQVKRHTGNIGPSVVVGLRGHWGHRADRLILISVSDFTQSAREAAREHGAKEVSLVSGEDLASIMIDQGIGITKEPVVRTTIDERFFEHLV